MTQQSDSNPPSSRTFSQRSLLMQGLSWLSGIGFLGGSVVLAQTPPDAVVVPTTQDISPSAVEAAPVEVVPIAPPAAIAQPERVAPEPAVSAPQVSIPESRVATPDVATPDVIVPVRPSAEVPIVSSPDPAPSRAQVPVNINDLNDIYIDPTSYNLGATRGNEGPSSIVLSERTSGCQAVLQAGQGLPGNLCASAERNARATSLLRRQQVATNSTRRVNSVNLGPVRLSSNSIGAGSTSPSGRAYYNNTRPQGRIGNGNVSLIFPLAIPAPITSLFGWRIHPITGNRRFHQGTDLGAPMGTPVVAAYAGRVAIADFMRGYGLTVVLGHNESASQAKTDTAETLYAHMSELFVKPGEWVEQGTVIGRVGSTGNSTGPHLHFEYREQTAEGWTAMDPGAMLEYALAELVRALQMAQNNPQPQQPQSGAS